MKFFTITVLIFVFCSPVAGQQRDSSTLVRKLTEVSAQNRYLRVHVDDNEVLEGRLRSTSVNEFVIGPRHLDLKRVTSVERRFRRRGGGKPGAIIGAVVGLIGTLPLRGFVSDPDSNGSESDANTLSISATGVGALLGLCIGSLAKPGEAAWAPVWP